MNPDKKMSLMISGYYGFGNAGDEAILAAMIQQIRDNLNDPRIIVLSENPESTRQEFGVESFKRDDMSGIFHLMKDIDLFISGGGGLVQDSTGFPTVMYYLSLVQMAKLRGKKVMLYAHGLGPIRHRNSKVVARFVMNQADLITYRDEKSKHLSETLGITKPPLHVTADPVFALKPAPSGILEPVLASEGINTDRFKMGISVRPWKSDIDYIEIIAALADSYIRENNAEVFLFPFQESQDLEVCERLAKKMENPVRIIRRNHPITVLFGMMGKMDLTIGMRLHSLIFSVIQGVPAVGVSYDPKVSTLMQMTALPWVDVTRFSRRDLFNVTAEIFLKRNTMRDDLLDRTASLKNQADKNIEFLKILISE